MKTIRKNQYIDIIKALHEFEENINRFYLKKDKKDPTIEFGYLIDKKILDDLKKKLDYEEIKNKSSEGLITNQMNQIFNNIDVINYQTCEQILFNDYKELEEDLKNNNSEYIIVNAKIYALISKKVLNKKEGETNSRNNKYTKYKINSEYMILFLKNDEQAFFKHNSNIINYSNLIKNKNSDENSNNIKKNEEENKNNNLEIKILKKKIALAKMNNDNNKEDKIITTNNRK